MKRLLIVDDQSLYLKSLELPLKRKFDVTTANCYADAIGRIERGVELVLLDIRLDENDEGNIDGLRILEWISMNRPDTASFVMSAYKEFHYAEQALNLGARHFFKKPLDIISLMAILEEKSA